MTQAELAGRLGVRQQTVSRWVSGDVLPNPGRVPDIEYHTKARGLSSLLQRDKANRIEQAKARKASAPKPPWLRAYEELEARFIRREAELEAELEELRAEVRRRMGDR